MLVAFVGIAPGSDPRTLDPEIARQLALVYVPALVVLYIGGAGFLFAYRIDRASHEANVSALEKRDREAITNLEAAADPAE